MRGTGGETRDRLREAALRLFAEHGVDAVTLKDIAEAVGIRTPSIYHHWRSREELVSDLFASGYAEYGHRIAEAAGGGSRFADRVEAVVRLVFRLHHEDRDLFSFLLLTQHRNLPGVARDADTNPIEALQRMVEAGMAKGEIPGGDPALVTAGLVGVVIQPATFSFYGRLPQDLSSLADQAVEMAIRVTGARTRRR